ncbi:MAG: hypothetical protein JSR43_09635 [Proteobacteria bacterium]|jgi:hypothetical protein|nr:hypothetical protein [Pseudomonadota bacterium]
MPLLEDIHIGPAPGRPGYSRVTGQVLFSKSPCREPLWYEFPHAWERHVSVSGEAWLAALLPMAFLEGEDIDIRLPADPDAVRNARRILHVWKSWYPRAGAIVDIRVADPGPVERLEESGARGQMIFFSGGVDSYYSLLQAIDRNRRYAGARPLHLATVWGIDIPVARAADYENERALGLQAAQRYGTGFIDLRTNIREFAAYRFGSSWYADLSFGAALASAGLLFPSRISEITIASGADYATLAPYGSHPMTDLLFGNAAVRIDHDGADCRRPAKTEALCRESYILDHLRVCWNHSGNCSRCSKCLRTMATIDVLGKRGECHAFDWSTYGPHALSRVVLQGHKDIEEFDLVRAQAVQRGRGEIATALARSMRISALNQKVGFLKPLAKASNVMDRLPLLWHLSRRIRRALPVGS